MGITDEFIARITAHILAFCKRHELTANRFGEIAVNDHRVVAKIKDKKITVKTTDRLEIFMAMYDEKAAQNNIQPGTDSVDSINGDSDKIPG